MRRVQRLPVRAGPSLFAGLCPPPRADAGLLAGDAQPDHSAIAGIEQEVECARVRGGMCKG